MSFFLYINGAGDDWILRNKNAIQKYIEIFAFEGDRVTEPRKTQELHPVLEGDKGDRRVTGCVKMSQRVGHGEKVVFSNSPTRWDNETKRLSL